MKHLLTCSSGEAVASLRYSWAFLTFSSVSSVQHHATALLPTSGFIFIRLTTASPWLPWSLPFTLEQTFCPGSTPPHSYFAIRWKVQLKRTGLAAHSEGNCFSSFPLRLCLIYRKVITVSASKKHWSSSSYGKIWIFCCSDLHSSSSKVMLVHSTETSCVNLRRKDSKQGGTDGSHKTSFRWCVWFSPKLNHAGFSFSIQQSCGALGIQVYPEGITSST